MVDFAESARTPRNYFHTLAFSLDFHIDMKMRIPENVTDQFALFLERLTFLMVL